jgi:hypothetical protein
MARCGLETLPFNSLFAQGEYFKLKGKCFIQDTNGADAAIDMREPNQRTCLTDCSIAERGQSGQPAFVQNGTSWVVRGVLSHGPPTGQCYGYDTYTEVDAMHYKFLDQVGVYALTDVDRHCNGLQQCLGVSPVVGVSLLHAQIASACFAVYAVLFGTAWHSLVPQLQAHCQTPSVPYLLSPPCPLPLSPCALQQYRLWTPPANATATP